MIRALRGLWALLIMMLVGCTPPDAYYRLTEAPLCHQEIVAKVDCANPACSICKNGFGVDLEVPDGGCQIGGSVGVTLCVSDCSICDE